MKLKMAFHKNVRQSFKIAVIDPRTGERKLLTDRSAYDLAPDWQPLVT